MEQWKYLDVLDLTIASLCSGCIGNVLGNIRTRSFTESHTTAEDTQDTIAERNIDESGEEKSQVSDSGVQCPNYMKLVEGQIGGQRVNL